ncbi:zinc-binding alcohol dehydrogenase family protein [Dellaglioa algida]|nr:zinc-binding alcohol dehydrogenase family protein [Dellaglioa algida]MDK1732270.1 zinc-binding alcohol dehydrogenase family protein [Dellaglioa algida]MDK1733796.1 zinc-binding alcohol dehydrogenase family protein [Dellaglioa algida]
MINKMKAVAAFGKYPIEDVRVLKDVEIDKPVPQDHDILVKIAGISVNPIDFKTRMLIESEDQSRILGFDAIGTVSEIGANVTNFVVGDKVFYLGVNNRSGSNEEYQLVDERLVGHAPKKIMTAEAVAIPLTGVTAWESLFEKLAFVPKKDANQGQSILIINGAGGVGSIAIQLAKWAGIKVITTASRPETIDWVKKMGADIVINHRKDLKKQLDELGIHEVDGILMLHSTELYFNVASELIKPRGIVMSIVATTAELPLSILKNKSNDFKWLTIFTKGIYHTADMASQGATLNQLAKLLDEGSIKSTMTKSVEGINADNLRAATKTVEGGAMIGKLVITGEFDAEV